MQTPIREYMKKHGLKLREVYRMVERGELKTVEVEVSFQKKRKIKHIVEN